MFNKALLIKVATHIFWLYIRSPSFVIGIWVWPFVEIKKKGKKEEAWELKCTWLQVAHRVALMKLYIPGSITAVWRLLNLTTPTRVQIRKTFSDGVRWKIDSAIFKVHYEHSWLKCSPLISIFDIASTAILNSQILSNNTVVLDL